MGSPSRACMRIRLAAGPDGLMGEHLKAGGEGVCHFVVEHCERISGI